MARPTRQSLHQDLWMMDLIGGRPPAGPRSLRNVERMLGYFDGLGLDTRQAIDIASTIGTYVMGAVLREVQERSTETYTEQMLAELSPAEREKVIAEFTDRIRATGRYPHLTGSGPPGGIRTSRS